MHKKVRKKAGLGKTRRVNGNIIGQGEKKRPKMGRFCRARKCCKKDFYKL
jgi:hypothetical protein